jgi:phosphatidylserine/phosphatidylglycerophosphate/cardiolipin synthase-like enzyme
MTKSAAFLFLSLFSSSTFSTGKMMEVVITDPTGLNTSDSRSTQEVWVEMVRSAKSEINLEEMNVWDQPGQALSPVIEEIRKAAQRGVHVRFLVDSTYFLKYSDTLRALTAVPNIEARVIDYKAIAGGIQHAKFFVVDGREGFLGSQNFDWRSLQYVFEVGIRTQEESVVADMQRIFQIDWLQGNGLKSEFSSNLVCVSLSPIDSFLSLSAHIVSAPERKNPDGIPYSADAITALIDSAQSSVHVQVMDYSTQDFNHENGNQPWTVLDRAIRKAAKRGVEVKLIVDKYSLGDGKSDLASLSSVENVEVRQLNLPQPVGITVPDGSYAHAKYLVVDGIRGWVGSDNWSEGYFLNARELGLVFSDSSLSRQLERIFNAMYGSPYSLKIPE